MDSQKIQTSSLVIGAFMLAFAVTVYWLGIAMWRESFCVGFGSILAALGTKAKFKNDFFMITGAGAIALIFYWAINYYPKGQITFASIEGEFTSTTKIVVTDKDELLGGFRGSDSALYYSFVIEGESLYRSHLVIDIDAVTVRVNKKDILPYIHRGELIEWRYDAEREVLVDIKQESKEIGLVRIEEERGEKFASWYNHFFQKAWAGGSLEDAQRTSYEEIFKGLQSDNLRERNYYRSLLSQKGPLAIKEVLGRIKENPSDKKLQTGGLYSVSRILEEAKAQKQNIQLTELLSPEELRALVDVAKSGSPSAQRRSFTVLSNLEDPRILEFYLRQAKTASRSEHRELAVRTITNFYQQLSAEKQREVSRDLYQSLPRQSESTQKMIQKLPRF